MVISILDMMHIQIHNNTYNVNVKGSSAFKITCQASAPLPVAIPEIQNQVRSLILCLLNSCRFSEMWNGCARDCSMQRNETPRPIVCREGAQLL